MQIFLTQKVTGGLQKVTGGLTPKNAKSHGTIIDNLSDYSEDKYYTYGADMGACND
jgi:hypothetical protein